jgi:hypothetical protein
MRGRTSQEKITKLGDHQEERAQPRLSFTSEVDALELLADEIEAFRAWWTNGAPVRSSLDLAYLRVQGRAALRGHRLTPERLVLAMCLAFEGASMHISALRPGANKRAWLALCRDCRREVDDPSIRMGMADKPQKNK